MRWSMSLSTNTRRSPAGRASVLAALLLLGAQRAPAQDAVEERYQRAVDLFNSGKMIDEVCELLQQVEKEKPGYKQTKTYLGPACNQATRAVKMEEDRYNEGVGLFNQGQYEDAKQKFEQANKIPLKNPRYRTQASRYLKDIEARQSEDRLFQEGVGLFNAGKHADAFSTFEKVVRGGGPKAEEARKYLGRLQQLARAPNPPPKPTAKPAGASGESQLSSRPQPKEVPKGVSGQTPTSEPSEQTLRAGLQEYFEGKFDDADRDLSEYINNNGSKRALAFFFRGATRSTRYYLSGQKDTQQKDLALADFRALKEHSAQFEPPTKYVSPQILTIYNEAVIAR